MRPIDKVLLTANPTPDNQKRETIDCIQLHSTQFPQLRNRNRNREKKKKRLSSPDVTVMEGSIDGWMGGASMRIEFD